ncbi:MAG: M67 family metallopeptidase [Clostridiales bacterium]|jgi:proteasome lid subunit RPN8/RPN11|nr:M67 family metallopeptidase [Clostridiales bacterium]
MKALLKKDDYDAILAHARAALPNEACGLLGGKTLDGGGIVEISKVYLLKNADESPFHFSMTPTEQFAAVKDMRANGFGLIGNFHSHPSTPARPSEEDKRLAFDPNLLYFILSLEKEEEVLKGFRIGNGAVEEVELKIES